MALTTLPRTVALVFALIATEQARAQAAPCLTSADTAAMHIRAVTHTITYGDSARLAEQGLPYRPPEGVMLVTDSATCQQVIDVYNALAPSETSTHLSRAYVLQVGQSVYAMVAESTGASMESLYVFMDSAYRWLAGIVMLH